MGKEKVEKTRKRGRMADWWRGTKQAPLVELSEEERLRQEIEMAREEWAIAQRHIDFVSDPELIDHAIYHLEAAERKYGYLLREAKKRLEKEKQQEQEQLQVKELNS